MATLLLNQKATRPVAKQTTEDKTATTTSRTNRIAHGFFTSNRCGVCSMEKKSTGQIKRLVAATQNDKKLTRTVFAKRRVDCRLLSVISLTKVHAAR